MSASTDAFPARRGRPGYDRDQVLAVAVALFNEQGYDATSVADLASRCVVADPLASEAARANVQDAWHNESPSVRR